MADRKDSRDAPGAQNTGDGVGGANSTGSGNILGGVQPKDGDEEEGEERRDA